MCGTFGGTCVCKAARWLSQTGPRLTALRTLSLARNNLTVVPPPVWELEGLARLDLSGNALTALPAEAWAMPSLELLDLRGNAFDAGFEPSPARRDLTVLLHSE